MLVKNSGSNIIIKNAQFHWVKLSKPASPFGTPIWEMSLHLDKKDPQITKLEMDGLTFKEDKEKGTLYTNLKRKAEKADGTPNTPVTVVDTNKKAVDPASIGNGSTGKVKLFKYGWEHNKKKGTSFTLMAVLVEDLIEFKGTHSSIVDIFAADDGEGGTVVVPESAIAKGKVTNATRNDEDF